MGELKTVRFGPVALSATLTTNILNPGTLTGGTGMPSGSNLYFLVHKITVVNKTTSAATYSLWLGATGANAAGSEVVANATSVAANSRHETYFSPALRLDVADFLVGGASAGTTLTFQAEGEIGVA